MNEENELKDIAKDAGLTLHGNALQDTAEIVAAALTHKVCKLSVYVYGEGSKATPEAAANLFHDKIEPALNLIKLWAEYSHADNERIQKYLEYFNKTIDQS